MSGHFKMEKISFSYDEKPLIDNFQLEFDKSDNVALLGPSGKGKSTILHLIAGFLKPKSGKIILDGQTLFDQKGIYLPPEKRSMGVVFQEHCLFPHLSVEKNIQFGYQEHQHGIQDYLDLIKLSHKANSKPDELSGGEQQRVSLARALASNPKLLLLDEPFSALDEDLRVKLREDVKNILTELKTSSIIVTHSKNEAQYFANKIIDLNDLRAND